MEKTIEAIAGTLTWRSQSGASEARNKILADPQLSFRDFPFSSLEDLGR